VIPSVVTPKRDSSTDDETTDGDVREFNKTSQFLDNRYGIRKDGDTLMIDNSIINVEESGDITIKGEMLKETKGLWELLTRKSVNTDVVTTSDMKRYKHILEMTNSHLTGYEPGGSIQKFRGVKFTKIIPKLFPREVLRHQWVKY
jgi:hypothetical protein